MSQPDQQRRIPVATVPTTLKFSNSPPKWIISGDSNIIFKSTTTNTYTYTLSPPSDEWVFSNVTLQVQTGFQSWSTYTYSASVANTSVLNNWNGMTLSITSFTTSVLTLSVTNNSTLPAPVYLGILLTVTNGSSSYLSPDPQLVLKPTTS
jgi:hypothetical protein